MKKLLVLLLLVLTSQFFGQNSAVFHLNNLSQKDTVLTGWKMSSIDNKEFSNPAFDDSKWSPIDLSKDISEYPEFHKAGIIWLRLHLLVDSSLKNELLTAHIEQYAASEVYLNGKLIQKYGTISNNPEKIAAYLPSPQPFPIDFLKSGENVIAVKLGYEPNIPFVNYLNNVLPIFKLYVNEQKTASENYSASEHQLKMYVIIYSISAGIMLIIGFIYFVYFLFDKSKKVHFYYAISMIALCLNALPIEVWGADRYGEVSRMMWVLYLEVFAFILGNLFILLTIYSLFNYRKRIIFNILIAIGLAMVGVMFFYGTLVYFAITFLFPVFTLLEGTFVCVWAMKNNKKDARIILAGVLFYLIVSVLSVIITIDSISSQLLFYVAQMSFPIGMSFYFGIQSSTINKQLRTSLVKVQNLSVKNLAQEQEKQQLLANQNELLEHQVTERTRDLNQSLEHLKATQSQLIQSEKMASLGELTAGIAHEIQNPLNFVNNFSEVSNEMIQEIKEERKKSKENRDETLENELLEDISSNLEKINHHGKRADAIVKGMLQHSRSSSGKKEPTDLNALCDEYLRLSYHGLRAKDKSFNATMRTNFDTSLEKINLIPQDFGRVILNLLTNAFYAVNERLRHFDKLSVNLAQSDSGYEPTVSISTKKENDKITIMVTDNGNGMPQHVIDKVFQPFFTTKPTGKGTGLGLSMSYDIITKGHNGELKVESIENEGTTFSIIIPN